MISILLVDDEPLLRLGFRLVLESQPDITMVGDAADGAAAISRTTELDPDVVVMGVRMPGMDGIDATREIVRSHPARGY
jgi:DNA-binding NarL/FixJ family response regulator